MRSHIVPAAAAALVLLVLPAQAQVALKSTDHRGNCRKGVPSSPGATKVRDRGRTVELVAHGSEYGHHCGEDQGRFAHAALTGDFDVKVQVAAVTNDGAMHVKKHPTPAKAGIMAREGNDPSDRYVAIWAVSNDALDDYPDSYHFDLRKSRGAWLGSEPKDEFVYGYANKKGRPRPELHERVYPNVWVRLVRKGDSFQAFVSKDGQTWHPTSTPAHVIAFARTLHVGVALSSAPEGHFDARSKALFQNLSGLTPSSR